VFFVVYLVDASGCCKVTIGGKASTARIGVWGRVSNRSAGMISSRFPEFPGDILTKIEYTFQFFFEAVGSKLNEEA